jgi:hypothetical protein
MPNCKLILPLSYARRSCGFERHYDEKDQAVAFQFISGRAGRRSFPLLSFTCWHQECTSLPGGVHRLLRVQKSQATLLISWVLSLLFPTSVFRRSSIACCRRHAAVAEPCICCPWATDSESSPAGLVQRAGACSCILLDHVGYKIVFLEVSCTSN